MDILLSFADRYADKDYDYPGVKEAVQAMVEAEKAMFKPDMAGYLAHLPPLPEMNTKDSAFMATEMKRIAKKKKMKAIDTTK